MIEKRKQRILQNKLNNTLLIKYLIKNLILKSILHNQIVDKNYKYFIFFLYKKKINKNKKICLNTGQYKSVNTKLNFSKHNLNSLSKLGMLQNYKIKSW